MRLKRGMALKTFNVDGEIYKQFSEHCKKHGVSMSRKVENFIREELERLKLGIRRLEKAENKTGNTSESSFEKPKEQKEHSFMKYC